MPSDAERGLSESVMALSEREERRERSGFRAIVEIGRTRQSCMLGTLLACSIAALNGTRLIDDDGLLRLNTELVAPAQVVEILRGLGEISSFSELAFRFCDELGITFH